MSALEHYRIVFSTLTPLATAWAIWPATVSQFKQLPMFFFVDPAFPNIQYKDDALL